jgi:hypothetical protein
MLRGRQPISAQGTSYLSNSACSSLAHLRQAIQQKFFGSQGMKCYILLLTSNKWILEMS